jgi:hypothetical protein
MDWPVQMAMGHYRGSLWFFHGSADRNWRRRHAPQDFSRGNGKTHF